MPSVWDDTRVLNASLGEYAAIARRRGSEWYLGTITNTKARTLKLDLNFLWTKNAHGHPSVTTPLPTDTGYLIHSYKDGSWKGRNDPFTVKVQPRVFYWMKPPKKMAKDGKDIKPPRAGKRKNNYYCVHLKPMPGADITFHFVHTFSCFHRPRFGQERHLQS